MTLVLINKVFNSALSARCQTRLTCKGREVCLRSASLKIRPLRHQPFTYASFSDTFPLRTLKISTPLKCHGLPSFVLR